MGSPSIVTQRVTPRSITKNVTATQTITDLIAEAEALRAEVGHLKRQLAERPPLKVKRGGQPGKRGAYGRK